MRAKMMGAFVNFFVVLNDHKQLQGCLVIFGLPPPGVFSIVLLRKPIPCGG